jgi:hypothetical protein
LNLSLCLPFYRNQEMLAEQYRVWSCYPEAVKAKLEIVLVDDGSPQPAVDVPRPYGLPRLRIYRALDDRPWHQHGCRNLAAKEADGPWLGMTDMDHVWPAESLERLLARLETAEDKTAFRFRRVDAPFMKPTVDGHGRPKLHVNSFAITKAHFWTLGGYDEDLIGYGTDGYFRRRLGRFTDLRDISIIRYPREVIPDASSRPDTPMDPRVFRNAGRQSARNQVTLHRKRRTGEGPTVLAFPWERVL